MKIFTTIYDKCLSLSKHRYATFFLVLNSFIESIFWPVPVDVMLAPMSLARPNRALHYALYATIASVAGAVIGYYLGYYLYDLYIQDIVIKLGWQQKVLDVQKYLTEFGILFVVIGSFTPIPYKVVAICCGFAAAQNLLNIPTWQLNILTFILVSFIGRGARFFLISFMIKLGGEKMEKNIRKYIDIIGWICIVVIAIVFAFYLIFK